MEARFDTSETAQFNIDQIHWPNFAAAVGAN